MTTNDEQLREQLAKTLGLEKGISAGKSAWFRRAEFELSPKEYRYTLTNAESELDQLVSLIKADKEQAVLAARQETDQLADSLVEKQYQLRIEHNHGDMQWYAYYAGKEQRQLFDDDSDWDTMSDAPTEALRKLEAQKEAQKGSE